MAKITADGPVPDELRCRRSDGRKWRCPRRVMEGKGYCEPHMLAISRQRKRVRKPVQDRLKVERSRRTKIPKPEEDFDGGNSDVPVKRGRKRRQAPSDDVSDKALVTIKVEDSIADQSKLVKDLKFGRMEIEQASPLSSRQKYMKRTAIKIGASSISSVPVRAIRSKNVEPIPTATVKMLPEIKAIAKKNTKKCHWCKRSGFCILIKCSTCNEQFFCEDCINQKLYCKITIMRECPVCQGDCYCPACKKRRPEIVKEKDLVIYDLEEDVIICDFENEMTVFNCEKYFDFSQHLHMIQELLPSMEKMNIEKIIELDTEAKIKGIRHGELWVPVITYPLKNECSFCKAGIVDAHRSCPYCPYLLCLQCCEDFREGYLYSSLNNLKNSKRVRTKRSKKVSWRFCPDGNIRCPPKYLGGCGEGILQLTSFFPFCLTKDLEVTAKQIIGAYKLKKTCVLSESELCLLCERNDEMVSKKVGNLFGNKNKELYFSTKQEFSEKNLSHFMEHWGNARPIIIRDVIQCEPNLTWDFGYLLCEYLHKSAESQDKTETGKAKSYSDWCDVEFTRRQIFSGGTTHENVWKEFLKFKLRFSLSFLQEHLLNHFNSVIESLPIQEYVNPFTGFLNLAANPKDETEKPSLRSYVSISYGRLERENPMDPDLFKNLCCNAYDMVDVLVHATEQSIPEKKLNEVKILMNKYNSQSHLNSSRKIANRNKLEEMFASSSRVDSTNLRLENTSNDEEVLLSDESETEPESESDDEDFSEDVKRCGARWDVFLREDVPKLLAYLRKYNDKLSGSYGSPKKVVHPLFDEVFYLNDDHKQRLKEEFNVEAWSFEQNVGEAVIIPAGCAYQVKKIKSGVNVVVEFISPESASESVKVIDKVRLLPVNHKAKGNMLPVKKMVINSMQKTIEEMRHMSQIEWSLPSTTSYLRHAL